MREPDLHELLRPPHDALLMRRLSQRLRMLAGRGETPSARREIDAALRLPWWGQRKLAIAAIGGWGGKANRLWLTERARRPLARRNPLHDVRRSNPDKWPYMETLLCRHAVLPMLEAKDADWLLDLWFRDHATFHELHGALVKLPIERLHARLERALASKVTAQIEAALWLPYYARHLPDRRGLLLPYAQSSDMPLSRLAKRLLAMIAYEEARDADRTAELRKRR